MKIILVGATGAMGQTLSKLVEAEGLHSIVAGVGEGILEGVGYDIYPSFKELDAMADVIIDFSHHSLVEDTLDYGKKHKIPIVIGTTGLTEKEHRLIDEAAEGVAILQAGNMSLGINVMEKLVREAVKALEEFDVEIVESHHNRKVDAPSGTAQMLADVVTNVREEADLVYGRHGRDVKRQENDVTIHSLRGGTIVGEHEVVLAGLDEVVTIKHQALSKNIFAKGALSAAKYLLDKNFGRYSMEDVIQ